MSLRNWPHISISCGIAIEWTGKNNMSAKPSTYRIYSTHSSPRGLLLRDRRRRGPRGLGGPLRHLRDLWPRPLPRDRSIPPQNLRYRTRFSLGRGREFPKYPSVTRVPLASGKNRLAGNWGFPGLRKRMGNSFRRHARNNLVNLRGERLYIDALHYEYWMVLKPFSFIQTVMQWHMRLPSKAFSKRIPSSHR